MVEIFRRLTYTLGASQSVRSLQTQFRVTAVRVWDLSHCPKILSSTFYDYVGTFWYNDYGDLDLKTLCPSKSVPLFLEDAWDHLPTRTLLKCRGIDLSVSCPICNLEDRSTEHAILSCPRMKLIWRLAGRLPWNKDDGPRSCSFLDLLR